MGATFRICVLPGDGIGIEVTTATLAVLDAATRHTGNIKLVYESCAAGAALYRETGVAMPEESWRVAEAADAIFLGAMGLPDVRYDDGTEITPQLDLRFRFDLYAGVRPVSAKRGGMRVLNDSRADNIDFVLVRESTEGLFASCGKGEVLDDREARDTMVITRETSEQLFEFTIDYARRRKASSERPKVTLVDKANIFTSMAFFRKVFDEAAQKHSDIDIEHVYVDACALDFVRRPWEFDVVVTGNMFGDILSDAAAMLTGSIGMLPSASLDVNNKGMYEPCHGSAPDIAGQGIANPIACILSLAMMLDHLQCSGASESIRHAVEAALLNGSKTPDLGGHLTTEQMGDAVLVQL